MDQSGPQNVVMGGEDPTNIPQTQVDEEQLNLEVNLAKFSKTKEYQKLKEHFENRIAFYQTYLPGGDAVIANKLSVEETGRMWAVANIVIGEMKAVLAIYEGANETVTNTARRKNS